MKIVKFIFIFLFVLNNADARDCVESTDKNGQKGYFVKDGEIIYDGVRNPTVKFCGMQRRDQGNKAFIATTAPARPPVASNTQISNASPTARADSITISGTMDPTNTKAQTVWGQLSQNGLDIGTPFEITKTGNSYSKTISPGNSGFLGAPGDYDVKVWYQNADNKKSGAFTKTLNIPGYCQKNHETANGAFCNITITNNGHLGSEADPFRSTDPLTISLEYDTSKANDMCVGFWGKVVAKQTINRTATPSLTTATWTLSDAQFKNRLKDLTQPTRCYQIYVIPNLGNSCVVGENIPGGARSDGQIRTWVEYSNILAMGAKPQWDRGGDFFCKQ